MNNSDFCFKANIILFYSLDSNPDPDPEFIWYEQSFQ